VAAVVIVAAILLFPTPLRVQGTLLLTAAKPEVIYPEVPGRLVSMNVRDGEWVPPGTVLATLSNPEKQRERADLQEKHDSYFVKALYFGNNSSPDSRAQMREHEQMARDLEPAIEKIHDQLSKLNLVTAKGGQVIGAPHPETIGQYLKPGKPFCEVGDPHYLEAHLILDQSDVDLINRRDPRVWIKIYGDSELTFKSKVSEIATRNREDLPQEMSQTAGGEIATKQDTKTGKNKPLNAVYEVIIPMDNPDLILEPGQRGFAKIDGGTHTLGWWLWRLITKTFHFNL
jgi:putative peptide zinc metalloprotease protein